MATGVFSIETILPAGVIRGVVRTDMSTGQGQRFDGGAPSAGQAVVVQLDLDPGKLTLPSEDAEDATWLLMTGRIAQASEDTMLVVDLVVTTLGVVPEELDGAFKAIIEREGAVWELRRITPM